MVNVTLCFSAAQALLAAKAGATFVSPFVGRHDDNGFDGMQLISDIRLIYDNYGYETEILVVSVRHGIHVLEAAKNGADVRTHRQSTRLNSSHDCAPRMPSSALTTTAGKNTQNTKK